MIVKGYEYPIKILKEKKSVIIGMGHLGNWELFGAHASLQGYPINVIYRPLDNKILDKYINQFRTKYGIKLISKFSSPLNMIRVLNNNEILCVIADQNTIKNYIYVPFFGKIAAASSGLSFFHLKTNSPILLAYSIIDENFNQYGFIEQQYNFDNLYNNLTDEQKHFLYLFNITFNDELKEEDYFEKLRNFSKFYSIENRFEPIKSYEYENEINSFKNLNIRYSEMNFSEKSFYITYFFHQSLEKIISKNPENWLLVHPRFRKQPKGFKSIYSSKK